MIKIVKKLLCIILGHKIRFSKYILYARCLRCNEFIRVNK